MAADQDVSNDIQGIEPNGQPRAWAWVRGRARKVVGDVVKKPPFTRTLGSTQVAATTSQLDHSILAAEQLAWRYIDQFGVVWDLGDFMIVLIEQLNNSQGQAGVAALRATGSKLRQWPQGFPGKPSFE
jgi:hypothetical protein